MLDKEQEPKKGKKKKGLNAKMGLDVGSTSFAPPAAKPGLFPGSAEGDFGQLKFHDPRIHGCQIKNIIDD